MRYFHFTHTRDGQTLSESICPGESPQQAVQELARSLNLGAHHPETLLLFTLDGAKVEAGDHLYDGAITHVIHHATSGRDFVELR